MAAFTLSHRKQFVFDQQALIKHGVMARDGRGGKRAFRVYPPGAHR